MILLLSLKIYSRKILIFETKLPDGWDLLVNILCLLGRKICILAHEKYEKGTNVGLNKIFHLEKRHLVVNDIDYILINLCLPSIL